MKNRFMQKRRYFILTLLTLTTLFISYIVIADAYNLILLLNTSNSGVETTGLVVNKYHKKTRWIELRFRSESNEDIVATVPVLEEKWRKTDIGDRLVVRYSISNPKIVTLDQGDIGVRKKIFSLVVFGFLNGFLIFMLRLIKRKNFVQYMGRVFRGTNTRDFSDNIEKLEKAGFDPPIERLEAHYLAKGSLDSLVTMMISAKQKNEEINFDQAFIRDLLEDQ